MPKEGQKGRIPLSFSMLRLASDQHSLRHIHFPSCKSGDGNPYVGKRGMSRINYPLVIQHNYGQWPFIVDFSIENGDFP